MPLAVKIASKIALKGGKFGFFLYKLCFSRQFCKIFALYPHHYPHAQMLFSLHTKTHFTPPHHPHSDKPYYPQYLISI